MSGAIEINLSEIYRLNDRLAQLADMDTRGLMDAIGMQVELQTTKRIHAHGPAPDGDAWDAWSDDYAARRPDKGGLLELEGDLLTSIAHKVSPDGKAVEIGSNLVYAAIHQFGGTDDMPPGPAAIPARPYLGLSDDDGAKLVRVIDDWLDAEIARTLQ